jgi:hypothetical protein
MAFGVYLVGGPEPVPTRKSQNPRMITVDEPTGEIVVPVEGGRQGVFRYTEETIAAGASVATVFVFVEIR